MPKCKFIPFFFKIILFLWRFVVDFWVLWNGVAILWFRFICKGIWFFWVFL
jgi:hypothetical protein